MIFAEVEKQLKLIHSSTVVNKNAISTAICKQAYDKLQNPSNTFLHKIANTPITDNITIKQIYVKKKFPGKPPRYAPSKSRNTSDNMNNLHQIDCTSEFLDSKKYQTLNPSSLTACHIIKQHGFPGKVTCPPPRLKAKCPLDCKILPYTTNFPGKPRGLCPPRTKQQKSSPITKDILSTTPSVSISPSSHHVKPKHSLPPLIRRHVPSKLPPLPIMPVPPIGKLSKKLQWKNIPDSRTIGSIWETLLIEEFTSQSKDISTDILSSRLSTEQTQLFAEKKKCSTESISTSSESVIPIITQDQLNTKLFSSENNYTMKSSLLMTKRFTLDYDKLTHLFFEDPKTPKKQGQSTNPNGLHSNGLIPSSSSSSSGTSIKTIYVLDSKRRQNVEICVKGLGLLDDLSPLINTVVHIKPFTESSITESHADLNCLSVEHLQIVLNLFPTNDEEKLLRDHIVQLNETTRFGKAEQFLIHLLEIDDFKRKAECCLTRLSFVEEISGISEKLSQLSGCISMIIEELQSGVLRILLAFILRIGNYFNHGSNKAGARGFHLECLTQLKSIKSVNQTTTLLRFIADIVQQQHPEYWKYLADSIGTCHTIVDVSVPDTTIMIKQLVVKIKNVEKELTQIKDQLFCQNFNTFTISAKKNLIGIEKQLKDSEQQLLCLIKLCGDTGKTPKDAMGLIKLFDLFWRDLQAAHIENKELQKKLKEQLLRERRRRSTVGNQTARPFYSANPHTLLLNQERSNTLLEPLTARPNLCSTHVEWVSSKQETMTDQPINNLMSSEESLFTDPVPNKRPDFKKDKDTFSKLDVPISDKTRHPMSPFSQSVPCMSLLTTRSFSSTKKTPTTSTFTAPTTSDSCIPTPPLIQSSSSIESNNTVDLCHLKKTNKEGLYPMIPPIGIQSHKLNLSNLYSPTCLTQYPLQLPSTPGSTPVKEECTDLKHNVSQNHLYYQPRNNRTNHLTTVSTVDTWSQYSSYNDRTPKDVTHPLCPKKNRSPLTKQDVSEQYHTDHTQESCHTLPHKEDHTIIGSPLPLETNNVPHQSSHIAHHVLKNTDTPLRPSIPRLPLTPILSEKDTTESFKSLGPLYKTGTPNKIIGQSDPVLQEQKLSFQHRQEQPYSFRQFSSASLRGYLLASRRQSVSKEPTDKYHTTYPEITRRYENLSVNQHLNTPSQPLYHSILPHETYQVPNQNYISHQQQINVKHPKAPLQSNSHSYQLTHSQPVNQRQKELSTSQWNPSYASSLMPSKHYTNKTHLNQLNQSPHSFSSSDALFPAEFSVSNTTSRPFSLRNEIKKESIKMETSYDAHLQTSRTNVSLYPHSMLHAKNYQLNTARHDRQKPLDTLRTKNQQVSSTLETPRTNFCPYTIEHFHGQHPSRH